MERMLRRPAPISDANHAALDLDPSLRIVLNGLWINPMLFAQDPCGKRFRGVVIVNRDNRLDDDRTRIDSFIGEMDGTAGELDPVLDRFFLYLGPGEGREQCWMDVHDARGKGAKKLGRKNPHEPRQHHKFDLCRLQFRNNTAVIFHPSRELAMIDDCRRNSMGTAPLKRTGVLIVADDYPDFGIQSSPLNVIDDRLKVGAASRDKNTDADPVGHTLCFPL